MSRKRKESRALNAELTVRIPVGLKADLERLAHGRWLKSSDLVREALVAYVRSQEKEAA